MSILQDEKDGEKLLSLYRQQRKFTYPTLSGRVPFNFLMYFLLEKESAILSKTIGGRAKTRLRKEAKGNPFLEKILKRGECV